MRIKPQAPRQGEGFGEVRTGHIATEFIANFVHGTGGPGNFGSHLPLKHPEWRLRAATSKGRQKENAIQPPMTLAEMLAQRYVEVLEDPGAPNMVDAEHGHHAATPLS